MRLRKRYLCDRPVLLYWYSNRNHHTHQRSPHDAASHATHLVAALGLPLAAPSEARRRRVELTPSGESLAVVVQLKQDAGGQWCVYVDGSDMHEAFPLAPLTLVVQVWLAGEARVMRGSVQLHGTRHVAPVQSNGELIELVQAWLAGEKVAGARKVAP